MFFNKDIYLVQTECYDFQIKSSLHTFTIYRDCTNISVHFNKYPELIYRHMQMSHANVIIHILYSVETSKLKYFEDII